jgi:hypothetical protein
MRCELHEAWSLKRSRERKRDWEREKERNKREKRREKMENLWEKKEKQSTVGHTTQHPEIIINNRRYK